MCLFEACTAVPTPTALPLPLATRGDSAPTLTAPAPTNVPAAPPAPGATLPAEGGAIAIAIAGVGPASREFTSLPPFIADALYDALLEIDPTDGALKPGLAEAWQVADDARTFSFHLRAGVRWHDGAPLTAQDVVFTIKTLSDPALRSTPAADFGPLAEVSAVDNQNVTVRFKEPYCAALTGIGTLKILPAHVFQPATAKGREGGVGGLAVNQLIGTGPLMLKAWNGDALVFTRNADYWQGAPHIAEWTYKIFANSADARAALTAGKVDVLALDAVERAELAADANLKIYPRATNQFYALALNNENDLFKNARVRQALAASLDRARLVRGFDVWGGDAQLLETSALKEFWATPPDVAQPAYDPARARQLLIDAGWRTANSEGILEKEGKPLRATLWTVGDDPIAEPLAFALRAMLAQAGIQPLLQLNQRGDLLTRLLMHEYDLAVARWNIPLDPDQHWYWQSDENQPEQGLNFVSYNNPRVDALLKQGNRARNCDPAARREIYSQVLRALAADVPQILLFAPPAYLVTRPRMQGAAPSPFAGDYWNLNAWSAEP